MSTPKSLMLELSRRLYRQPPADRAVCFEAIRDFIHRKTNGAMCSMTELANDALDDKVPHRERLNILSEIWLAIKTCDLAGLDLSGNPAGEQQPTAV